jgi:membrane protease YdiL (CAAX protease family)
VVVPDPVGNRWPVAPRFESVRREGHAHPGRVADGSGRPEGSKVVDADSHPIRPAAAEPGARWRRAAATMVPVAMPAAMHVVFRIAARRFGPRRGYQAGFAVYWAGCWAAALAIAGPRRLAEAFGSARRPLPAPRPLAAAALSAPPVGAVVTEFLPHARRAGPRAVGASIFIGITNALAEEAFWRALPVVVFPADKVRGWWWPAAWFTAWHLVPLAAAGAGGRRTGAVVTGAGLIGAGYGWIALKTGSVSPLLAPHAVTDASGVRMAARFWCGRAES